MHGADSVIGRQWKGGIPRAYAIRLKRETGEEERGRKGNVDVHDRRAAFAIVWLSASGFRICPALLAIQRLLARSSHHAG